MEVTIVLYIPEGRLAGAASPGAIKWISSSAAIGYIRGPINCLDVMMDFIPIRPKQEVTDRLGTMLYTG